MSTHKGKASLEASASKVPSFKNELQFVPAQVPALSENFIAKFKANSAARKDYSGQHVINVLPNFVPILCYILYHVNQYISHLEHTKHSSVSAGTFTAYCLAIVYGYILCCDLYIRPSPSMHATVWQDETHRQRFTEFLMTLPVPDFISDILVKLTPTVTEHRGNILFVPSAAGFSYAHSFGRFFPLIMFTNIHDTAAETQESTSNTEVLYNYYRSRLYTILQVISTRSEFAASSAHFLGTCFHHEEELSTYGSKLEQVFEPVFQPLLFRDYPRRQLLSSVSLTPQTYTDDLMNFYDLMFSASPANFTSLRNTFTSVSGAMKSVIKCPGDLASHFKTFSGLEILRHGYSFYALPTFHHSTLELATTQIDPPHLTSPDVFSSVIRFLRVPAEPETEECAQPISVCTTAKEHDTTSEFVSHLNRLSAVAPTKPVPSIENDFVTFSEDHHVYPNVYVLGTDGSTVNAWNATAFGMVIESADIDGTVIPVPNVNLSLGIENSWFADSSVPLDYVYPAINFDTELTSSASARKRTLSLRQSRFPAASLLIDRIHVNIPIMNPTAVTHTATSWIPGLTSLRNVNWPEAIQSFFGFRTADPRSPSSTDDSVPGMPSQRLLVWSPYTYVGVEGTRNFVSAPENNRIYYVTNLRTLFGTDPPLVEVSHGLEAMPIP